MMKNQEKRPSSNAFTLPFVLSLPHCSGRIPQEIRPTLRLNDEEIEESTDMGTRELFGSLPARAVVCARWSRLVVDLNRAPNQNDAKGVIALADYHGRAVYREGFIPNRQETEQRLKEYYRPFHNELQAALSDREIKGLFDCHSLYGTGPVEAPDAGKKRKDIILSNNGDETGEEDPALGKTTCSAEVLRMMRNAFQRYGFSVSINDPYAGGFITTHYGRLLAGTGRIAVQIEINQDLYCEAGTSHLSSDKLEILRPKMMSLFEEITKELSLNRIRA